MNIYLSNTIKPVNPYTLFKKLGYEKNGDNGFVLNDDHGRFHLLKEAHDVWKLHYDVNVEWRHVTIDMPYRCGKEKKRIKNMKFKLFGVKPYNLVLY